MTKTKLFNRNFSLMLLANVVMGSVMPMLIILGGLAGAYLSPTPLAATLPPSVQMLAGILMATPISLFMGRAGRRAGFLVGAAFMFVGGLLGMVGLLYHSFLLLNFAHLLLGGALVCAGFFRFAAAEVVSESSRPKAISLMLASGLFAAIIGPSIFSATTNLIVGTAFAGAYLAISAIGLVGAVVIAGFKSPGHTPQKAACQSGKTRALFAKPDVVFAISAAAVAQAIMVLLMTPTALAMVGYGFDQNHASDVIRWHVIAMFAPGFFTGHLIARFGTKPIIYVGLVLLGLSAAIAIIDAGLLHFYGSLIVLGVGWNFGFIGATNLLQDSLSTAERPLIQGTNDTLLAIASSAASLLSGALYVGIGWTSIAAAALCFIVVVLLAVAGFSLKHRVKE